MLFQAVAAESQPLGLSPFLQFAKCRLLQPRAQFSHAVGELDQRLASTLQPPGKAPLDQHIEIANRTEDPPQLPKGFLERRDFPFRKAGVNKSRAARAFRISTRASWMSETV